MILNDELPVTLPFLVFATKNENSVYTLSVFVRDSYKYRWHDVALLDIYESSNFDLIRVNFDMRFNGVWERIVTQVAQVPYIDCVHVERRPTLAGD